MHVASAVVIMVMEMPAFPNQFHAEQTAENDQHDADDAFCRRRKRLWDRHAKHEGRSASTVETAARWSESKA